MSRPLIAVVAFAFASALVSSAAMAADDVTACRARHLELSRQAQTYQGEQMMKRIIQADLERANKEMMDGDADECMEALDHATLLLSGKV